jgi:hypothetical protein
MSAAKLYIYDVKSGVETFIVSSEKQLNSNNDIILSSVGFVRDSLLANGIDSFSLNCIATSEEFRGC